MASDSLDRLLALSRHTFQSPGQILALAFDSLASGKPTELRAYVKAHAHEDARGHALWRAWKFDVPPVTVRRAEVVALEFGVTRQVLVTVVIDCLTEGWNGGGKRTTLEELLRIIYTSATLPPSAGSPNPAEAAPTA